MKLKFDLQSKVVVVTGGAGLLGTEFSKAIALAGGTVVVAEKDILAAHKVVDEIIFMQDKAKGMAVELDITNRDSIKTAIQIILSNFGKIDCLVNNAYPRNKNYGNEFFDVLYSDFCENLGMNLGGYFLTSQIFAQHFRDNGGGNIINISSIYGVIPPKFEIYSSSRMTMPVEYAAIKAGLIHLTKYMAKYFKGMNIRVNSLSPGGILDKQDHKFIEKYNNICLTKGMLDKEDVAGALIFLLSDASCYLNGQNIIIDDGFTL